MKTNREKVLGSIQNLDLTQQEIAVAAGLSLRTVSRLVRDLREEDCMHIASYEPPRRGASGAIFRAGRGVDAPNPHERHAREKEPGESSWPMSIALTTIETAIARPQLFPL